MIEILCTLSAPSVNAATSAWPLSCTATISRSFGLIRRFFLRSPAITRSIASSKALISTWPLRHHGEVARGRELHALHVDPEDGLATLAVGPIDDHLAVETARAQERRVEHFGPVGGGEDDHALGGVEAVHLDQELVQRVLALV